MVTILAGTCSLVPTPIASPEYPTVDPEVVVTPNALHRARPLVTSERRRMWAYV